MDEAAVTAGIFVKRNKLAPFWLATFLYRADMQVALSPHAEQLLREALARNPEHSREELLEQLLNEDARRHAAETTDALWRQ